MSQPFPLPQSTESEQPLTRRRPGLLASFRHAYEGLIVACGQRNMKLHVVSAVLVCLVGSGIKLGLAEKVSLIFCVMLMFFAEILNTALEALVDLHTEDYRQLAKTTKDAAAASVLVLAMGTVIVFAAICVTEWRRSRTAFLRSFDKRRTGFRWRRRSRSFFRRWSGRGRWTTRCSSEERPSGASCGAGR